MGVGVISNERGEYLIARRGVHQHQGGRWEFPGGKVELGETHFEALRRELREEVGITVTQASPFFSSTHRYSDKTVRLWVYYADRWDGDVIANEGQPLRWCTPAELLSLTFPEANQAIIHRLQLGRQLAITPADFKECVAGVEALFEWYETNRAKGVTFFQLRLPHFSLSGLKEVGEELQQVAAQAGAIIAINGGRYDVSDWAEAMHLPSQQLSALKAQALEIPYVGASCHTQAELELAHQLNLDYVTLSPVHKTASHPEAEPLGWSRFAMLSRQCWFPCYALGGVSPAMSAIASQSAAYGIAGIGAFQ